MNSIRDSVIRASDSSAALSDRHNAFGELVIHFQDLAFAYSFAVLGDAYLAEDVAQEAFISAWHLLPQLREPEAFPGWFKRILRTQCNRLLRNKRLQFVSSEAATHKQVADPGPAHLAEYRQLFDKVLKAIKELPDKQRLVTMLFYVNGYTQDDIGRFLDVPISTVNKRLYTARERLKEQMVQVVKRDLQEHRPSRNNEFSNEVTARLRPLTENDWPSITRLAFGRTRRDHAGKELWLTRRQKFADSKYVRRQYVAEEANSKNLLGYGAVEQSIYLPRYKLFLVVSPRWLRKGVGDLLLDQLFKDLHEAGAVTVSCHEQTSKADLIEVLRSRDFKEVDRQLDSRLELSEVAQPDLVVIENMLTQSGVTVSTLTKLRTEDPACIEKLYQLSVTLAQENDTLPFKPAAYDVREARMWLQIPYVLPDGYFIARRGDLYVGILDVNLHESLPHGVTLSGPGVLREYRRQGIGTALMLKAIEYAKAKGYAVMRTFNRPSDKPLLRLIRKIGFKTEMELITVERFLRPVVRIDPKLYEEYEGSYLAERPQSSLNMIVRTENNRLTLECVGQKVELFPTSETEFFIKMFYGEVTFGRNAESGVGYLDYSYKHGKSSEKYRAVKLARTT